MTELPELSSLPLILVGSILRRTEPDQVTVWFALKEPKRISLRIFDQANTPILTGTRKTVALGARLHVVAVTTNQLPPLPLPQSLNWGEEYFYNLAFADSAADISGPVEESEANTFLGDHILFHRFELKDESSEEKKENRLLRLSYSNRETDALDRGLPSFSMAPEYVADLCLIHDSCRKPHGEGVDQLAKLDELIDPANRSVAARTYLLFLSMIWNTQLFQLNKGQRG